MRLAFLKYITKITLKKYLKKLKNKLQKHQNSQSCNQLQDIMDDTTIQNYVKT